MKRRAPDACIAATIVRVPSDNADPPTPRSSDGPSALNTASAPRRALRGQARIANARLAYAAYQEVFVGGPRYEALTPAGARPQRPLWASTGVKNPDYSDTMYVTELVAPHTVNTMPAKTIAAVAEHGVITGDTITGRDTEAQEVFAKLAALGVDLSDVFVVLEDEGVEKFAQSWRHLLEATQGQLDTASK